MKAQEGENNVNIAGQNLLPLDEIRISPLMSKVNGPARTMGGNTLLLRQW
jgi:hypothetical protein